MSDKTPEFRFEGHEGEKFAFVQTQENFFYNSELLFIEYDDIIKSIPFGILEVVSVYPRVIDKVCDTTLFEGFSQESLYEFYITRKEHNIFKKFLRDDYKKMSDRVYELYNPFLDMLKVTPEIVDSLPELNFCQTLKSLLRLKDYNKLAKKILIWSPIYHDVYKDSIEHLFGSKVKYVYGNLEEVLKDQPKDTTYVFSNIENINIIEKMDRVSLASFAVPYEYEYNFNINEDGERIPKVDITKLSAEHCMKFNYFYGCSE